MMSDKTTDNRRILIIDDNASIHDDFRKILETPKDSGSLDQARAALFGEALSLPPREDYELDFASQGREGCGMVHSAYGMGRPYALAFVDMRMPPGWDGLETIENLWYVDPSLEIVICTAYSDHPWEDVSRRVGNTDKLLILMKPFNSIEVVQLAHSLTKKWNLACSVKRQIESLESSARRQTAEWRETNDRLQERIAMRMAEIEKDVPHGDAAESFRGKEEFLAIMSYEILTPVNELAGTADLLLDGPLNPAQRVHAATIQRCADDLLALHTDLHEFMAAPRQEIQAGGRQ
ncbi:MAG: response regulator [Nitrospira sp.]|nr:MAG: response regulator [Nitrospira sp.]